jgi:beta-1,4-mannosyltransferase
MIKLSPFSATVFHDRPPARFRPADLVQKHKLFLKLSSGHHAFRSVHLDEHDQVTLFTKERAGKVLMRNDRPFLLISSTSWTKDEDFGVLLEALEEYNTAASYPTEKLPKILCIITGKCFDVHVWLT